LLPRGWQVIMMQMMTSGAMSGGPISRRSGICQACWGRIGGVLIGLSVLTGGPAWAGAVDGGPRHGAVLGVFATAAEAEAAWAQIRDTVVTGLPPARTCVVDGRPDGPVRLTIAADSAAEVRSLCGALHAVKQACRPMTDPCSSVAAEVAARPAQQGGGRSTTMVPALDPSPPVLSRASGPLQDNGGSGSTQASAVASTEPPPSDAPPGDPQGGSLGPWSALANDLAGWSFEAESETKPEAGEAAFSADGDKSSPPDPSLMGQATDPLQRAVQSAPATAGETVDRVALDAATAALTAGTPARAVAVLRPRAEAGDPVAAYNLAILLAQGMGTERDDSAAAHWMTVAAEAGLVSAQNTLALMYLHGRGVPRDRRAAVRWLAKAARAGHPLAQANLVRLMETALAATGTSDAPAKGMSSPSPPRSDTGLRGEGAGGR